MAQLQAASATIEGTPREGPTVRLVAYTVPLLSIRTSPPRQQKPEKQRSRKTQNTQGGCPVCWFEVDCCVIMASIPIATVRQTALEAGFNEIQYNEQSRVISFQKTGVGRINVYYTTGTVATCIYHPHRGKTQLFRRNQTPKSLKDLFQNPRVHTGAGYYTTTLRTGTKLWTSNNNGKTQCDDARRWLYVQSVTDFCTPQQAAQIAAACELWNKLRFADDLPTSRQQFESYSPELQARLPFCPDNCGQCGQDCAGSFCNLGAVLALVAHQTDPETLLPVLFYLPSTEDDDAQGTQPDFFPMQQFAHCECSEGRAFHESHLDELERFKRQLMSFPRQIRHELLFFFFKKIAHSYELVVKCEEGEGLQTDEGKMNFNTYGAAYLSYEILQARHEYGDLVHDNTNTESRNCSACGLH